MKVTTKVDGLKELDRALNQLPDKVHNRVLQSAVTSSIRKARKAIKTAAPRGAVPSQASEQYGPLHKNLKVGKARTKKSRKSAFVSTGKAFWGYFLEYGTRSIPARPWFVPAFERSQAAMMDELKLKLRKGIDKQFAKMVKK